jgi:hypothetical protein
MVGGAGLVHLSHRFLHVFLDPLQVVPVMNLIGNRDPGGKRQTHRKNRNYNRSRHNFSSQLWIKFFPTRTDARYFPRPQTSLSKGNKRIPV